MLVSVERFMYMLGRKSVSTLLEHDTHLFQDDSPAHQNILEYRILVGRLIYLRNTRLDITFATQQLGQFLNCPTKTHFKAAFRVLRFLKANPGRGLFFSGSASLHLQGFANADWGGCPDT